MHNFNFNFKFSKVSIFVVIGSLVSVFVAIAYENTARIQYYNKSKSICLLGNFIVLSYTKMRFGWLVETGLPASCGVACIGVKCLVSY